MVEEKGVSGYTNRTGEVSTNVKAGNGYSEEPAEQDEQHLHQKSSSMMHEEASDDSYLQVRTTRY